MRIPTFIYPEAKDLYAELRRFAGRAESLRPNKLLAAGGALVPLDIPLRPPKLYPVAGCAAA
jgi:hypothetical protein